MDIVLERGIARCFPDDECLQTIARCEFARSNQCEDESKADTLAMKAIKTMMQEELLADDTDVYSHYLYKLIFKEPIEDIQEFVEIQKPETSKPQKTDESEFLNDWDEILESEPIWRASTAEQLPTEWEAIAHEIRKEHFRRMRSDGAMMYAILDQLMPKYYGGDVNVKLTRYSIQLVLKMQNVAEIPHRDGIEFDTYWAEKFTKLGLAKKATVVFIRMIGNGLPADKLNINYMTDYLNKNIIEKLGRVIPAEGYEQYMKDGRSVYGKMDMMPDDESSFGAYFFTIDFYFQEAMQYIWGYVESC